MLLFDVQNEGVLGMEAAQRAIAFVAFGNKIFAARIPVRVRFRESEFPRRRNATDAVRLRAERAPSLPRWLFCHAFRR